jgi:hypothetical protein
MTIQKGALVNIAGGSFLQVNGNLIHLANASVLSLMNGPVVNVAGGSRLSVTGGLFSFSGPGNVVKVTNNLCAAGACRTIGGLPVALTNGATASNVSINGAIKGAGTLNVAPNAAVLVVNGPGSKVTIGGK